MTACNVNWMRERACSLGDGPCELVGSWVFMGQHAVREDWKDWQLEHVLWSCCESL